MKIIEMLSHYDFEDINHEADSASRIWGFERKKLDFNNPESFNEIIEAIKEFEVSIPLESETLNKIDKTKLDNLVVYMLALETDDEKYVQTMQWVNRLNNIYHRAVFAYRFTTLESDLNGINEDQKSALQQKFTLQRYLDVSPSAFTNFRKGKNLPSSENLLKIATYYGVTLEYLINFNALRVLDQPNIDAADLGLTLDSMKVLRELAHISSVKNHFSQSSCQSKLNTLNMIIESYTQADCIYESLLNNLSSYLSYDPDFDDQYAIVQLNNMKKFAEGILEDYNEGKNFQKALEEGIYYSRDDAFKMIDLESTLLASLMRSLHEYKSTYRTNY